ncbi:MAG: amidohydrolase family protein, partial [Dehalococcoidia bacterium]
RELERCLGAGIRGVGEMRPDVQGFDLRDRATMEPLVEVGRDHGAIFLIHASEPVGHEYTGKGTITPDVLYPFICQFPDIALVLAHWGGGLPFYALMPEVARALENVYFDSSASSFLYRPQVFRHVMDIVGAEKMLFGSDYPLVPQHHPIREIEDMDLPPEAKKQVMGENARRLLGW